MTQPAPTAEECAKLRRELATLRKEFNDVVRSRTEYAARVTWLESQLARIGISVTVSACQAIARDALTPPGT